MGSKFDIVETLLEEDSTLLLAGHNFYGLVAADLQFPQDYLPPTPPVLVDAMATATPISDTAQEGNHHQPSILLESV